MLLITLEHFENFWDFFYFSHVIFGQTETNYGEKKTNKIVSKLLSVGHRAVGLYTTALTHWHIFLPTRHGDCPQLVLTWPKI